MLLLLCGSAFWAVVLLQVVTSIRRNNSSGLKDIPNAHFTVPFSRIWLLSVRWRSIENRTRVAIHRRLGPVVRIAPNEVSVNCIDEGVRTIYGSSKFEKEGSYYRALMDQIPVLFTMLGSDEHNKRRRMLTHIYSKSNIMKSPTLDNILSTRLESLKETLSGCARSGASIDIFGYMKACTMDIVVPWLYGTENGTDTLRHPELERDLTTLLKATFDGFFLRAEVNWLIPILKRLGVNPPSKSLCDAEENWRHWSTGVIEKAHDRHGGKSSPTANVYDHLFASFRVVNPDVSSTEAGSLIAAECEDQLMASHQGLGIALAYAMYELSQRPESQKRLRKEVLALAVQTKDGDKSLSQRMDDLPVLDAVVNETLRLRSPGPGPFPRVVPEAGCKLAGAFEVPGSTIVSSSVWALHGNPAPFPSPDDWRPERWLDADEKALAEMWKWFWAFGSGPRMCIGNHLAMRVIKEVLFVVYTNFETLPDEDFTGNVNQIDPVMGGPVAARLPMRIRSLS